MIAVRRQRALIEMLAMRLPDALAAQKAHQQGQRRIGEVIKRQDQRWCPEPLGGHGQEQPADHIAKGNAADIAEKNLCRWPIPAQKSRRGGGGGERQQRQIVIPRRSEQRYEGDAQTQEDRLAAGDAVNAVHEIVEIDEPDPQQRGGDVIEQRW
jgi:hypothetical protein